MRANIKEFILVAAKGVFCGVVCGSLAASSSYFLLTLFVILVVVPMALPKVATEPL